MRAALLLLLLAVAGCRNEDPFGARVECRIDGDCAAGRACASGACVVVAAEGCDPGRTRCDGNGFVEVCSADGTAWARDPLPCVGACDDDHCTARACAPFSLRCSGQTVLICTNDGTRWVVFEQCPGSCGTIDGEAGCTSG